MKPLDFHATFSGKKEGICLNDLASSGLLLSVRTKPTLLEESKGKLVERVPPTAREEEKRQTNKDKKRNRGASPFSRASALHLCEREGRKPGRESPAGSFYEKVLTELGSVFQVIDSGGGRNFILTIKLGEVKVTKPTTEPADTWIGW